MKVAVNCIVKNEDRWIWYAINSVMPYVDKIMICDTGSTDNTLNILKSFKSPKIHIDQRQCATPSEVTLCRQEMWSNTRADWVVFVDGDEIWPDGAIKSSLEIIKPEISFLISCYRNLVGDVFHYQPESAGKYKIRDKSGNITIRWVNKKLHSSLHWINDYPLEALSVDGVNEIQKDSSLKYEYCDRPYLHATYLRRSSANSLILNRKPKPKIELGIPQEKDFGYPRSFYFAHESMVENIWKKRSNMYVMNAFWQTPLRKMNRFLQKNN